MGEFNQIIAKICQELGIKMTLLSDSWLTILEYNNKVRCIQGYKFPLNDHGIGNVMDDKGLFYDLMVYKHNPIIEHFVIFKETKKELIKAYFDKYHQLVVKGNIGSCGMDVYLVSDEQDLFNLLDKLFTSQFSISLCPYYEFVHEYRVIVLNGQIKTIYGKNKPKVIGNGKSTLLELSLKLNPSYYHNPDNQVFDINYVPKMNEEVTLNFQFNLSRGATFFMNIKDEIKNKLEALSLKVLQDTNIKFGSIDIVETTNDKLLLMEANSGVMMDNLVKQDAKNYTLAYNIYKEAIITMFEDL